VGITSTQFLTRTEAERRYAELATKGMTNEELGDALDALEPSCLLLGAENNYLVRDDGDPHPFGA